MDPVIFYVVLLAFSLHCLDAQPKCPFSPGNRGWGANDDPVVCAKAPARCPADSKYRSFDGSCNNLKHPEWGMANTRYGRLVKPRYADKISTPTVAVSGGHLPSARVVSNAVFLEANLVDPDYTIINMQWGQVVAHEMSLIAGSTKSIRNGNQCCTADGKFKKNTDASCFPISIFTNDTYYSKDKIECMNFVRTITDFDAKCDGSGTYAEQLNIVTPFLDLSILYDVDEKRANSLRTFSGGRLKAERRKGCDWLPSEKDKFDACDISSPNERCYRSGDMRVNQNLGLTMTAIIHLREHNRLADELRKINPHWKDEQLFQEARKINIAEYQHITFYEWLPIMLGLDKLKKAGIIYDDPDDYINDYDDTVHPQVLNEHATAAFRYFHSQIEGQLKLLHQDGSFDESLRLSDFFHKPSTIEEKNHFGGLLCGFVGQAQQITDFNYDPEIRDFFQRHGRPYGDDLRAIDVQRNRDHGLATYNDCREFYGKPRATKWDDYSDTIGSRFLGYFKTVYASFDDVDLTVGVSSERHEDETLGGPLLNRIMVDQFYKVRVGDRFFYENGADKNTRFTKEQLAEIRKATVSRQLCDNSCDDRFRVQRSGFEMVTEDNPVGECSDLPKVDLSPWKEQVGPDIPKHEDSGRPNTVLGSLLGFLLRK